MNLVQKLYDTDSKLSAVYPSDQQKVTIRGITKIREHEKSFDKV